MKLYGDLNDGDDDDGFRTHGEDEPPRPQVPSALTDVETTLLELGTGSGCIAVTLACLRSDLHILATDMSEQALATASRNW